LCAKLGDRDLKVALSAFKQVNASKEASRASSSSNQQDRRTPIVWAHAIEQGPFNQEIIAEFVVS